MNIENLTINSNELSIIKRSLLLKLENLYSRIYENEQAIEETDYDVDIDLLLTCNGLLRGEIKEISTLFKKLEGLYE